MLASGDVVAVCAKIHVKKVQAAILSFRGSLWRRARNQ